MWIPVRICYDHWRTGAYLQALQPRLSPAQPGRDRWGERHKAPCPADSSPSFPNSLITPLFLFFLPCSPSHFAGRTGRLTPPLPRRASLSLHLCSPTQMPFPHLSQGLLLFLLLSLSLSLCLSSCLVLRGTSGVTDPWQERSCQTAQVLQREVFSPSSTFTPIS